MEGGHGIHVLGGLLRTGQAFLSHPRSGWEDDLCNVIFIPNPTNALWSAVVQSSSSSGSEPTEQVKTAEATDLGRTWDTRRHGRYLSISAVTGICYLWENIFPCLEEGEG